MTEILKNVHLIDSTNAYAYLIVNEDLTLIDTGSKNDLSKILTYIKKLGRNPKDLKQIVITHHHIDHIGCLSELKKHTDAKVLAHAEDARIISGEISPRIMKVFKGFLINFLQKRLKLYLHKLTPVEVDVRLRNGDLIEALGGLKVIHTPGHTPGSICLYQKEKKILFVGDLLFYETGEIYGPSESFTLDMGKTIESIKRVSDLDFDAMLSGHGDVILKNAGKKVREFVSRF